MEHKVTYKPRSRDNRRTEQKKYRHLPTSINKKERKETNILWRLFAYI